MMKVSFKQLFNILSGPVLFLLFCIIPNSALTPEAKLILALYIWIIAWWVTKPIPWGLTSLLPLIVVPLSGLMSIADVSALYGQRILFFLIGVLSLGLAVDKHGLGKRLALAFLSKIKIKTVSGILLSFLVIVALLSAFVDDAATIAICIPIGMTIIDHIKSLLPQNKNTDLIIKKLSVFMSLGILYSAEAGGIMTVAGIPHIAISISILEQISSISLTFADWSKIGIIIGIFSFIIYFLLLKLMIRPKQICIDNANELFKKQYQELGKMSKGEKYTIFVLISMVLMWVLPGFISVLEPLNIWMVPVVGTILLYILPLDNGENVLTIDDFQTKLPWDIIFLIIGGGAMSTLSEEFGIIAWMQSLIPTGTHGIKLLFVAAFATSILSNFISGTATVSIMSNIFMPLAASAGINPVYFAYILPASGMAIMLPWAGAATGTAFSANKVSISEMIKCGSIASIVHLLVTISILLVVIPIFY